jgi:hypothetical protein
MIKNEAILKLNRFDFLLAAILMCASLFSLVSAKNAFSNTSRSGLIYNNGVLLKTLDMSKDSEFSFGHMRIENRQGKLMIAESDCPRKICCHSGAISDPGQVITCVPNKVFIEVSAPDGAVQYNATTY